MIMRDYQYPRPWAGYTVPEFGGRLNGLGDEEADFLPSQYPESTFTVEQLSGAEEDAAILARVVADAQATQSIHKEMIQHIADWETREPGRLASDDDLRAAFIQNLEGLRSAFMDRGLEIVGVPFPMMLDRANPAHAVILAIRDDIADTRDRLQANKAQELLGKQIAAVKIGLPEMLARQATDAASSLMSKGGAALEAGGKGLQDALKTLAWVLGGGVVLYLVTQKVGGK